ncbi:phosphate acetyltransferase [Sedimentimonas flavescens]|uniref:phosphate acetyltransferase n=1 Tax=Sedimentimonas flavescens TaxID=2851012 RepID=UPI001C4A2D2F|nr:phosphate acetyltransferase [Sedimentimonas flavescens]MBW0159137.1 phosphate acetyltransferase [Sedimentimonas flavescens]
MKVLDDIYAAARTDNRIIILPEGEDPRIQAAALRARRLEIASPVLLGDVAAIESGLRELGAAPGEIEVEDPRTCADYEALAQSWHALRAHKGTTLDEARRAVADPMLQAALRVRLGHADGTVGGAVATTAETVRVALQSIGCAPGNSVVSSFFLMMACADTAPFKGGMIFSDCGLVVSPDARQLAAIARAAAQSCRQLLKVEPQVAMLSFSTAGSASHESIDRIRQALAIVREEEPDLNIDGEIQFDAALDVEIRARKAPGSRLAGRPNVFIFPDLASGNIGYKIAQRLGGLQAIGPVLQGLAHPANDLSRGCSVEDVVSAIAITAVQSQMHPQAKGVYGLGCARYY